MAVYIITGKLGSGKTLCTVGKIKDYLEQGRRVATNLDINLENMLPEQSKQSIIRLPDKPRLEDMECLGSGCVESDESKYGLIVLDELGTWFNARNWRDKERLTLIDWFLHARKHHWDIYFIVQSLGSLDGQLVSSLCEHLVVCKRTDRLSIPIIGSFIKWLGFASIFPKIHIAKVYYGASESSIAVDRWWYRGKDLYDNYKTDQKFSNDEILVRVPSLDKKGFVLFDDDMNVIYEDAFLDMRAPYTVLSPYHQNHIQLRKNLSNQLAKLSGKKTGDKITHSTNGGFYRRFIYSQGTMISVMSFLLVVGLFGISRGESGNGIINQVQAMPQDKPEIKKQVAVINKDLLQNENIIKADLDLDHFQSLLPGAILRFQSFVSDGHTYYANLRIIKEGNIHLITLDELRMNGYWVSKEKRFVVIEKDDFKIRIKI